MPEKMDMEWECRPSTTELCSHKDDSIEQRREFYGLEPIQFYTYFFCTDCNEEVEYEPNEDLYRER